jgi:hypothetical protein
MKAVARYLSLFAVLVLASQALAIGVPLTSTCWLTCRPTSGGGGLLRYTEPGVTESACCSGQALRCPPGYTALPLAWGNPAELCSPD